MLFSHPAPVVEAIDRGDEAALARLVQADPGLVHTLLAWDGNHCSPLHYVANARFHGRCSHRKQVALATILLDAGAEVDSRASGRSPGETVLQTAASLDEPELCAFLLQRGADVDAGGGCVDFGTALALAVHFGMTSTVDLLVKHGASIYNLPLAAGVGAVDVMAPYFDFAGGLRREAGARHPDDPGEGPLWTDGAYILQRSLLYASVHKRDAAADLLLTRGAVPDAPVDGATPLHWTVWWGDLEAVRGLVERGASLHHRDPTHDATPREWAAYRKKPEIERYLAEVERRGR